MDNELVTGGDPEGSGISRRTLIKAGAVVGGTIWVAPVIESFTNKAAAVSVPPGGFPCSYATIIFTVGTGTTLYAVKINDPNAGCNETDTDGSYKSSNLGSPCNGVQYAVNSNNQLTANGSVINTDPAGGCQFFTINGCTITAAGATIQFVLIHDGSFGNGGTVPLGTTVCGPSSSFTVPNGACGC